MDIKSWYEIKYSYGVAYGRGLPLTADEYCNALCEYVNTSVGELNTSVGELNTSVGELNTSVENKLTHKVDKTIEQNIVYATDGNGNQSTIEYDKIPTADTIVRRTSTGGILVGMPTSASDAVPKEYVDSKITTQLYLHTVVGENTEYSNIMYVINNSPTVFTSLTSNMDTSLKNTLDFKLKTGWGSVIYPVSYHAGNEGEAMEYYYINITNAGITTNNITSLFKSVSDTVIKL